MGLTLQSCTAAYQESQKVASKCRFLLMGPDKDIGKLAGKDGHVHPVISYLSAVNGAPVFNGALDRQPLKASRHGVDQRFVLAHLTLPRSGRYVRLASSAP